MNPFFRNSMEPVPFDQIGPEDVTAATEQIMAQIQSLKSEITTGSETDRRVQLIQRDALWDRLDLVLGPVYLLMETHPDQETREACQAATETLFQFSNALALDEDLFRCLDRFADREPVLTPIERRYLQKSMETYHRNGFKLDQAGRVQLKEIDDRLNALELTFQKNVSDCDDALILTEKEMAGLSEDFKNEHRLKNGTYQITTQTPDYTTVSKLAQDGSVRKRLYYLYHNRSREENLPLLDEILKLRVARSKLLGFSTYVQYKLESVMAKEPKRVWSFLNELSEKIAAKSRDDYQALCEVMKVERIEPWDKSYATNLLKETLFDLNEEEVRRYFPLDQVSNGLFDLAQTLYQIEFRPSATMPVWHPDVRAFEAYDKGKLVGRFYLDMYPRSHKYSHAACFGLQSGRRMDGGYQTPTAALVCNFSKPTDEKPSLLTHREVETFFHEFGHLMHHLLTTSPLAAFAGTSVEQDFVEMPSQIMENWVWEKEALRRFAFHHETGDAIPDVLVDKMLAVRHMNSGLDTQQQIFYAALDLAYHDGFEPNSPKDTTALLRELQDKYTFFPTAEGVHFQASFTHLVGYAGGLLRLSLELRLRR